MKKKINLVLCFISILMFLNAHAQTSQKGVLRGNVVDQHKNPLDNVSIALLRAQDSTVLKISITSNKGTYAFDHLPDGHYLITLNMVGYTKVTIGPFQINAQHQGYQSENISLGYASKQLDNVNIVARKPLVERQADKTVLNIENSILATGNTAMQILKKAPGVTVDKDGNISLKGNKGVSIMMNGKLTYLSNEEIANLLNATEGNAIASIELITNPSAKYDASGNSGIINIKLKKNRNYGTNGTVTAGAGYGRYYKANSGLSFNNRQKKFNFFGDVNYSRNKTFTDQAVDRISGTGSRQTFFDQTGGVVGTRNNTNYKTGLDYFINENHTIGVMVNGYVSKADQATNILTRIGNQPDKTDSTLTSSNPNRHTFRNTVYNLNYKGMLDTAGQEISFDADFSRYKRDKMDIYYNTWRDPAGQLIRPASIFRNPTPSLVQIWVVKADYIYPFSKKTKLDLGVKSSFVNTDNNSIFENLVQDQWLYDLSQSNHFLYKENINAGYANFHHEFKSTTIQLGLRAEQTNSKGNSIGMPTAVDRHYLDFFPSIFVNQLLSKNHEIGLSYSKRIQRPSYSSLNPFIRFLDAYTYYQGNPFLKPEYTNSFELSWSYKKTFNASLGYRHTADAIAFTTLSDTVRKTVRATHQNLASSSTYNLNINVPVPITNWWTTSNDLTVFYNKFATPDLFGSPFKIGKTAFNFNSTHTIKINTTLNTELSGLYYSRYIDGTSSNRQQYSIDMGISKTLLDKKLNIKLAASDIFNTYRYVVTSKIPGQSNIYDAKEESRVFRLTATYYFGNSSIKGTRNRSKGSAEEQRRI
jgi:outer membrane receptor protein involved in Fe transport